jgi:hypothetical protein
MEKDEYHPLEARQQPSLLVIMLLLLLLLLLPAQRLQSANCKFQSDLERLWDLVQPLLLDADVEVGCGLV